LVFVPAACGSYSEYLLRPAPRDIFRRKEAGKVVTNNLVGCVTFDPFGTGIPTDNLAPRVHHEDGVVMDSIEEQPISFFAFSEFVLQKGKGVSSGGKGVSNRGWLFRRTELHPFHSEGFQAAEAQ
jgi:hypothetical protein